MTEVVDIINAIVQAAAVEKWFQKGPSVVAFDDCLQYYYKTMEDVDNLALVKDQDCIRLHMVPLADAIKQHAKQWIKCYGNVLHDSAKTGLYALKSELEVPGDMHDMYRKKINK